MFRHINMLRPRLSHEVNTVFIQMSGTQQDADAHIITHTTNYYNVLPKRKTIDNDNYLQIFGNVRKDHDGNLCGLIFCNCTIYTLHLLQINITLGIQTLLLL